ncbi:MAG: hypothetical protein IJM29_01425 [Bacteroidales bacterium]|nr:hypothetical protein [Bacteroidales bacterium]
MQKVQYTGNNFDEIKKLCGDKILAPYFCMGFSMLSLLTDDGFVTVNEGDTILLDDFGKFTVVP